MDFHLSLAAALAVVAQAPPAPEAPASSASTSSFAQLADDLDVVQVSATPPSPADASTGIPEPGTWSLVLMGIGVVLVAASRGRG